MGSFRTKVLAIVCSAVCFPIACASAAGPEPELAWKDLIPAGGTPASGKPKTFFAGSEPVNPDAAPPPPLAEGKFMQSKRRQPGNSGQPAVVTSLDGKHVRISGYVVPLDFEATKIKEFLLVPFIGACIHVPPPPANQIVYVKIDNGFEVSGSFDPVTVTGTMKTETAFTGLADAGYSMTAESVELRKE